MAPLARWLAAAALLWACCLGQRSGTVAISSPSGTVLEDAQYQAEQQAVAPLGAPDFQGA